MATKPRSAADRLPLAALGLALLVSALALAGTAAAQPTVNGLFYGDGDDQRYVRWATSYYGSPLYVYMDAPTQTLYVALIVDRSVNDNVFGASDPNDSGNYMSSAGWGAGRGQQRSAAALVDSEFASFRFACAEGSPREWAWQQGYACQQGSSWVSDPTCGTSAVLLNGFPPSLQSASSFAWNLNAYTAKAPGPYPWDLYVFGNPIRDWKSPFSATDPNTSPPNNPNTVIGLEGYPAATNAADLSEGPPITYSSTYEWEWPMVYEWSLHLGGDGVTTGAGCEENALFLITGISHHSPMKGPVEGLYDAECGEENDCFPPNPDTQDPLSDFGDLPDNYGTLKAAGGAQHYITVTGPYLGSTLELELDGVPTSDATGDGGEEDGVSADVTGDWTAGSTQSFDVTVSNAPGGALLGGWIDWNGDGDFDDPGEFSTWNVTEGSNSLSVTVGAGFDWQNDTLYARFRIFSSSATAPGGSLTQADSVGVATDGEVEDYGFQAGSLPVTLAALESEGAAGGELTVRWQTASETDNAGFVLWGRVDGRWQPLTDLVESRSVSTGLPQTYEVRISAPAGLTGLELVDHDLRGRQGRFGPFALGERHGAFQPVPQVDWSGPRARRDARLRERGFADTAGRGDGPAGERPAARWKKVLRGGPVPGAAVTGDGTAVAVAASSRQAGRPGDAATAGTVEIVRGPRTHVAVTRDGVQRVTWEALRDGGLDLTGVHAHEVAVTFRGEPVARWIGGPGKLGPGSVLEFVGRAPRGDDALYLDANLYQVSVDRSRALDPGVLGLARAREVSASYVRELRVDRPRVYRHQSPTGDPWVERSLLVRRGRTATLTLDLEVEGPVADGPGRLVLGLGSLSDLPDLRDPSGEPLPEHNVEVWFRGAGGVYAPVTASSVSGQRDWTLEATLPEGWLTPGAHQVELRFTTDYFYSLVVVDHYGVHYPSPYRGPTLDFAADPAASGYRVEGFAGPQVVAWAEGANGSWTRLMPRVSGRPGDYVAELRQVDGAHFWVTGEPHRPAVFTTQATPDLLAGPADLVVLAGSSFVGTPALDDYLVRRAHLDPVVVDVEDVFNAVGHGMALPSALTDYLRARDAVYPFTHVQLVGTDCYDRLNHLSGCVSFLPLPTAPVGANRFTPSQNRLVDLDGDGVGDKAVAQLSVRDDGELARIVAKIAAWEEGDLPARDSALFIAEETDGLHGFLDQVQRLRSRLGWRDVEILDLAAHPAIQSARQALRSSLDDGRTLTVYSGHSSPTVWAFRGLLTAGMASTLTNAGQPSLMVPLACETTWDVSPNANVLGHQLLFGTDGGAVAISGAAALSSLEENERMANHVLTGLDAGMTLGEAVLAGRQALDDTQQELQDNWLTQGDVGLRLRR